MKYLRVSLPIQWKKIQCFLPFNKYKGYTKFIILCHPRSGSTFLHSFLNAHFHVISLGEVLLRRYYSKKLSILPEEEYLNKFILKSWPTSIKAIGFKYFYKHRIQNPMFHSKVFQEKELKIIHLYRKNILRSYTSMMIAQKNQYWFKVGDNEKRKKKVHIDIVHFLDYRESLKMDFKYYKEKLSNYSTYTLSYEDFIQNKEEELSNILSFIGVKQQYLDSLFLKQNPENLEDLIENYEDIKHLNEYLQ